MIKVSTDKLRDGDLIHIDGATIRVEGKPNVAIGPAGRTVFSWPNASIVAGQLSMYPQTLVWTISGDTLAFWPVTRG